MDGIYKGLYGKVFADRGYIEQEFFENLFGQGIFENKLEALPVYVENSRQLELFAY